METYVASKCGKRAITRAEAKVEVGGRGVRLLEVGALCRGGDTRIMGEVEVGMGWGGQW